MDGALASIRLRVMFTAQNSEQDLPRLPQPPPRLAPLPLAPDVELSLQPISAGAFWMGSLYSQLTETLRDEWDFNAEPRHQVLVSEFHLGTYPVTQAEFAVFRKDHGNGFPGNPDHPAEQLSWDDAIEFCRWLNQRHGEALKDEQGRQWLATLPSEAQWEYACRQRPATTKAGEPAPGPSVEAATEFWNGDGEAALADIAWYDGDIETSGTKSVHTGPLGDSMPNGFGLHHLHGNVWEWCLDAYDAHAYRKRPVGTANPVVLTPKDLPAFVWGETPKNAEAENKPLPGVNPKEHAVQLVAGLASGSRANRVLRGGSCFISAWRCRSAYRFRLWPVNRFTGVGFRVCLVPDPASTRQTVEAPEPGAAADPRDAGQAAATGAGERDILDGAHFQRRSNHE